MDAKERARLRALRRRADGSWRLLTADEVESDKDIAENGCTFVADLGATDVRHRRCWSIVGPLNSVAMPHEIGALIVGAVNALPALLDDSERLDAATRERDEARAMLRNLLARVHRDGGQHSDAVGLAQATEEADEIIARDFAELARLRAPRPSAIVLRPVDPMTARGLPCACDEWGSGHLDGCPSGDESTDGRDA